MTNQPTNVGFDLPPAPGTLTAISMETARAAALTVVRHTDRDEAGVLLSMLWLRDGVGLCAPRGAGPLARIVAGQYGGAAR